MKLTRALILIPCFAMVASAFGQDSLLGKGKKDSPPPKSQSSGGSGGHTSSSGSGSSGGSRNNGGGSNDSGSYSSGNSRDQSGNNSSRDPWLQKVLSRKNNQSRSGKVHYGTVNNLINGDAQRLPVQIRQAPIRSEMPMSDKIQRQDQARVRDRNRDHDDDRFRVGYYQYGTGWRDDSFCYPYYVFSPYSINRCVVSPWYYYSFLPGYIETNRLVYTSNYQDSFVGLPFDYELPSRYRDDQYGDDRGSNYDENYLSPRNLNFAVDDLVRAFTRSDRSAVNRLVPRTGEVALAIDGRTSYGVKADDFYDMLMDAVTSSQTIDYQITAVKSNNNEAEVLATHVFTDPWGRQQYVYHRFHLFSERGNVVIRSFETSANPFW